MTAASPTWLIRIYALAMVVHAALAALCLGLAAQTLVTFGRTADSAPNLGISGLFFRLLASAVWLLPAVIPVMALLSWWLLRRRGIAPSPGHRALAIAGTLPFMVILTMGMM